MLEDRRLLSFSAPVVTTFGNPTQVGQTVALAARDLNADGRPDLVTTVDNSLTGGGDVVVLLGSGNGSFTPAQGSPFSDGGAQPVTVAIGDVNNDGRPDIVTAGSGLGVLLNSGTGTFTAVRGSPFQAGANPIAVALGDFNGDGNLDTAVSGGGANGTVTILLGNGTGTFSATGTAISVGVNPGGVVTADFNGDGRADLAVAVAGNDTGANGSVALLLGNGNGTFTAAATPPFANDDFPRALVTGDFNGDGTTDMAVLDGGFLNASAVSVLLNNGTGVFSKVTDFPVQTGGVNSVTIAAGDFNNDGRPDVTVANAGPTSTSTPGTASVLVNDGTGLLSRASGSPFSSGGLTAAGVATADFNGDGLPDVAVMNVASTNVGVLLNTSVTTTTLTATENGNQTITGIVTVTPAVPGVAPTGTVTLTESMTVTIPGPGGLPITITTTTVLGSGPVINGVATVTTGVLSPGTHVIMANYSGDATFAASHSSLVTVVVRPVSNVAVTASPNPATTGQAVTFTATVSSGQTGPPVTGTVTFADNGTAVGSASVGANGQATFTTSSLAAGTHAIAAFYSGDSNHAPGVGSVIVQVSSVTPVFGTPIENFVRALYQQVLHRAPDTNGFNDWVNRLQSGQFTREQVAALFLTSTERYTIVVEQFYLTLLGRAPDPASAFWINGLVSGALSQSDVVIGIVTSPEFTQDFPTNSAYAQALYVKILSRQPSPQELAFQTNALNTGLITRPLMAFAFLAAPESFVEAIDSFYTCLLRRPPTAAEEGGWFAIMTAGQTSPIAAEVTFLASVEYFALVQVVPLNQLSLC
jgi:hypothetical protein